MCCATEKWFSNCSHTFSRLPGGVPAPSAYAKPTAGNNCKSFQTPHASHWARPSTYREVHSQKRTFTVSQLPAPYAHKRDESRKTASNLCGNGVPEILPQTLRPLSGTILALRTAVA